MTKENIIIITENWLEAIEIHNKAGEPDFQESLTRKQYPTSKDFYNSTWYWNFDENGKLRGSAGTGAFISTLKRMKPGSQIFLAKDFVNQE